MHFHDIVSLIAHPGELSAMLGRHWLQGLLVTGAIVFLETGIVVFPFLPGDSLLFALGAVVGVTGHAPLPVWVGIAAAAILGDAVNYVVGRTAVGPWVLRRGWIRQRHLERSRSYFARYGGSAITIARFIPVVRTIAPFVAGMSQMNARRFLAFNILGGCLWSALLIGLGVLAGSIAWVQSHFALVTVFIIAASLVPLALQWRQALRTSVADTPS